MAYNILYKFQTGIKSEYLCPFKNTRHYWTSA